MAGEPTQLRQRLPPLIASAVWAVLSVLVAAALTAGLQLVALRSYFILFVPAVVVSTWFGGRLAGCLTSAFSVIASALLLPRAELPSQIPWLVVAGFVTLGTCVLTDDRRRVEARLAAVADHERGRRKEAESLSQLKTDVLAQVAHELRQPLNAIGAAAHLLDHPSGTTRQRALGVVIRQSNHLRELVDDLLELSLLARHEVRLRTAQVDLREVVDDVVHVIASELEVRGIALSSSLPTGPLFLTADATRVRQILSNLLSNAVKFTPPGGRIEVAIEPHVSHVVMRVRDTGDGIPSERLPQIFEMFHRGDGYNAGLGVGLAVVKGLTELHGGTVEARSEGVGRGSEFIVMLPLKHQSAA